MDSQARMRIGVGGRPSSGAPSGGNVVSPPVNDGEAASNDNDNERSAAADGAGEDGLNIGQDPALEEQDGSEDDGEVNEDIDIQEAAARRFNNAEEAHIAHEAAPGGGGDEDDEDIDDGDDNSNRNLFHNQGTGDEFEHICGVSHDVPTTPVTFGVRSCQQIFDKWVIDYLIDL